jgi:uncharacterized protein (DUF2147 family)
MKIISVCLAIVITVMLSSGVQLKAESPLSGIWVTVADKGLDKGKAKSHIEIYEKDGLYFARVVKLLLKPQDTLCDKCKGNLYNKPVVGMVFMSDMKKSGNIDSDFGEEYAGGSFLDPDNGESYTCKVWIKGDVVTMRGYGAFFYRTQKWQRVK